MSITQNVATRLRYCQEVLAVCNCVGMAESTQYRLIFMQDDGDYNEWIVEALNFDPEDYEGSDEELLREVATVITSMEHDYLTVYNNLKALDK